MDKYIGNRLDGRYQIDELVGEGGMADVYRATDLMDGRTVAVKILRDELRSNPELVRRFHNESRAISVLNHPNIVKVFDVSAGDKAQYIVMEYISGITLKEYIEQRGEPLTYKEVVHFMSQTLLAMQHAHDKGIIHRDIKPQNIMILEDGNIKVMDFGIARLARSEIHTAEEQAIGSVHYISPEQAQGADTDQRSDIYSAGVMMYEMLSGKLPFDDENAVSVAIKHISDEAVPLDIVNPSVPQGLVDITGKAMAKDPAHRYQSSLEMLRDIEEFKHNPSIKFEYEYMGGENPARHVNKIMGEGKNGAAPRRNGKNGQGRRLANGKAAKQQKPKRKKRIGWLVPIILGITIAVVGTCFVYSWDLLESGDNPFFGQYDEVELPDFAGAQYEEMEKALRKSPLNHLRVTVNQVYDPDVPAGTIMAQKPESDNDNMKLVKANQQITVTVSRGVETVVIPDIAGMSRLEAMQAISELGLIPYMKPTADNLVPVGKVVNTDPEAGMPVQNLPGTRVTVYVSSRSQEYETNVPNVVGQPTVEDAQRLLDAKMLSVGQIKEVEDAEHEAGTIVKQVPAANTVVLRGEPVHLYVAKGAPPPPEETEGEGEGGGEGGEMTTVPRLSGFDRDGAASVLGSHGLNAQFVEEERSDVAAGRVVGQSPGEGQQVAKGSTVTVTLAKAPAASETPPPPPSSSIPPTEGDGGDVEAGEGG